MSEQMNTELTGVLSLNKGDLVTGKISKVEDNQALVDIGYKFDGIIPIAELSSIHIEKAQDVVEEGQEVTCKVLRLNEEEGKLILSKRAVDSEMAWGDLANKLETGEIIEAKVQDVVKGGLIVDIGVRGFIPASLVERHFVEDFSDYKGRTLRLKVVELDRDKNKVILSQKAVLDEEFNKQKHNVLSNITPGQVLTGTVQRLTDFGVFVDIGGVDGLVHISELAWHRVEKPSDVVNEGDQVKVKVLKVDTEKERISLSIKETLAGPWSQVEQQFSIGDVVKGTVKRLVSFGAFVEIAPGVEGLVHISQISHKHIGTPHEVLKEGQEVNVKILDINASEQRVSLSIRETEEKPEAQRNEAVKIDEEYLDKGMGVTLGDLLGDQLRKLK